MNNKLINSYNNNVIKERKQNNIMKIRNLFVILITLFASIGLIACKEGKQKITICEVAHSVFYAPMYVAIELGYFEEAGLTVELVNGNGADKVMTALLSGDAQFGLMGPEASIYVYLEGQENYAINFAQLTRTDGSFIVGREEDQNFNLNKLKGKSILGGRKGGVPEMTLEYVLKKAGLTVGQDDETVLESGGVLVRTDIQFAAMAGAFTSGEGDYTTLFEPTATSLVNSQKGYIVASVGEYVGDVPYTSFSVLKNYMNENDETIQLFTDIIYKGQLWVLSHTAKEIAEVIHPQFISNTVDELTTVMQRYIDVNAWCNNPYFKESSLNNLMDIMKEANELKENVPYNKIVNTKYAENSMNKNVK